MLDIMSEQHGGKAAPRAEDSSVIVTLSSLYIGFSLEIWKPASTYSEGRIVLKSYSESKDHVRNNHLRVRKTTEKTATHCHIMLNCCVIENVPSRPNIVALLYYSANHSGFAKPPAILRRPKALSRAATTQCKRWPEGSRVGKERRRCTDVIVDGSTGWLDVQVTQEVTDCTFHHEASFISGIESFQNDSEIPEHVKANEPNSYEALCKVQSDFCFTLP